MAQIPTARRLVSLKQLPGQLLGDTRLVFVRKTAVAVAPCPHRTHMPLFRIKRRCPAIESAGERGGPPGDRTLNPRIKSPLLCQLS